jgi:hypothetical protein
MLYATGARLFLVGACVVFCACGCMTPLNPNKTPPQQHHKTTKRNAGLKESDMAKPQVGIASMWYEGNPCNMHLLKLAEAVKGGVEEAGLVAYRFNTIGVSDGISMGTGACVVWAARGGGGLDKGALCLLRARQPSKGSRASTRQSNIITTSTTTQPFRRHVVLLTVARPHRGLDRDRHERAGAGGVACFAAAGSAGEARRQTQSLCRIQLSSPIHSLPTIKPPN